MSLKLMQDFFPGLFWLVDQTVPDVIDMVYPSYLPAECRTVAPTAPTPALLEPVSMGKSVMKWPTLAPVAALGILVGFLGAFVIVSQLQDGKVSGPRYFSYGLSFFFFGCMNLVAIFFHCFLDKGEPGWDELYALDVGFTSVASLSLIAGALCDAGYLDDTKDDVRIPLMIAYPSVLLTAYLGQINDIWFVAEFLYLDVSCLAAIAVMSLIVQRTYALTGDFPPGWEGLAFASAAAGAFMLAPVDGLLCEFLGPNFTVVIWVFLGCDLAYVGLFVYLTASEGKIPLGASKKKASARASKAASAAAKAASKPRGKPGPKPGSRKSSAKSSAKSSGKSSTKSAASTPKPRGRPAGSKNKTPAKSSSKKTPAKSSAKKTPAKSSAKKTPAKSSAKKTSAKATPKSRASAKKPASKSSAKSTPKATGGRKRSAKDLVSPPVLRSASKSRGRK
eukprot:Clim_evm32s204 gene=Clim_evmTU32s204